MMLDGFVEYMLWPYMRENCRWQWEYAIDRKYNEVVVDLVAMTFGPPRIRHRWRAQISAFHIFNDLDPLYGVRRGVRLMDRRFAGQVMEGEFGLFTVPDQSVDDPRKF